jgi:hypothetical protein
MGERRIASSLTKIREMRMVSLFNGHQLTDEELGVFPCPPSLLREFTKVIDSKGLLGKNATHVGGMGKHYDMESLEKRAEQKVTKKVASPIETLTWRPWKDTVQFLQGQYKAKIAVFLGECGDPMMRHWFEQVVKPFSANISTASGMTCDGYLKAMSTIGMKGKQEAAAKAFIIALRCDSSLQQNLHQKWLEFEAQWLSTHTLDHVKLETLVKQVIEIKDFWICVSKNQVNWIDGLKVVKLDYVGTKPKRDGGMSFHYSLHLQRGEQTKQVPMECKFHWKNGGQAVQNLNFMLL